MKTRADRLRSEGGDGALAEELARDSGVPALTQQLERWAGGRGGALHAVSVCQVAERAASQMRVAESTSIEARDADADELADRLRQTEQTQEALRSALPALRRRLGNSTRMAQREIDTASMTRLNALRRAFDRRVAEGELDDFENDLEAALVDELETALAEVRTRFEGAGQSLMEALEPLGARFPIEEAELGVETRPDLAMVETPPVKSGALELLGRAPFAAGAVLLNPLYAVVAVAGLVFDRQRMKRRAQREQLSRQLVETVTEARSQISLVVNQATLGAQDLLTEIFEDAIGARRADLEEEVGALRARQAQSQEERAQAAEEAERRLAHLDDLDLRIAETRRAAVAVLRGGGAP